MYCASTTRSPAQRREEGSAMQRPRSKKMGVERGQRPNKGRSPVGLRLTRLKGYSSSTKVTSTLTL
jgi:hypothetical protein